MGRESCNWLCRRLGGKTWDYSEERKKTINESSRNNIRFLRFNWVSTVIASLVLWGFVGAVLIDEKETDHPDLNAEFSHWQSWITQNFTWLYILTQDVWFIFILWLLFTKYADVKLGKDDEEPEYSDFAWFSMLFSCGIGVGLYFYGVSEPIVHYRRGDFLKTTVKNDDQKAQQAIFQTLFHWGLHGWIPYIVVALALGVVCHRQGMPMTMRNAFHPLIGDHTKGLVGDIIDALSISCTTFGVCTSLGLGASQINAVLNRVTDGDVSVNKDSQTAIIWVITAIATTSVLLGLKRGIKTLSLVTFVIGLILLVILFIADDTWYLLNSFVQSCGYYMQWVLQVGFDCGTWTQLNFAFDGYEKSDKGSLIWGKSSMKEKLFEATNITTSAELAQAKYLSHTVHFMDWGTIFQWGRWISWAPFVGMFIAKISKGRTVGQVIKYGFITPIFFTFIWLTTFGSLGIKMQRASEMALDVTVDKTSWSIDCSNSGYTDNDPTSEKAIALADEGYYLLSCRAGTDSILDMLSPYGSLKQFLWILVLVGITFYFVTSSDSGSFVDDVISAQGHENPPWIQRVYWALTEAATAQALLTSSSGLGTIQAVSVIAGLPYTIAICYLCTSLMRALRRECRDPEILSQRRGFVVSTLDFLEAFNPESRTEDSPTPKERFTSCIVALFFPFKSVLDAASASFGSNVAAILNAVISTALWLLWWLLLGMSTIGKGTATVGWTFYIFFAAHIAVVRYQVRKKRNITGNFMDDLFASGALYPMALSQMEHEAKYIQERKEV